MKTRSTQDKVLAAIETAATDYGYELVVDSGYANTGHAKIESADGFDTVLRFYYRFNETYYQIEGIVPTLPGLKEPKPGDQQSASVWIDNHSGTTSADIVKAIRDHLATVKGNALAKELA